MNFCFNKKKISAILTILPAHEQDFLDDMKLFAVPEHKALKLKAVMGYDKHRIALPEVCVSDMAVFGLEYLFGRQLLGKDDIDALILVTQSPEHFMPPTSNIIQGRLNLKQDMFCIDINQGCAGFIIGLIQAFLLLEQPSVRKVVLINADTLSKKVSARDKNSYPLVGDAAAITVIERDVHAQPIIANLKMDGTRWQALQIPAGGFRLPSTPETAVLQDVGENNFRSQDQLWMDGAAVFNFVQVEVPPMIDDLLTHTTITREEIDYFFFHQPNKFMLEKLADKMQVPHAKMPNVIVGKYGNSSGVTIPTTICETLGTQLLSQSSTVCLAGFGVGLTWGAMLMQLGPLTFCELIAM